MSDASNAPEDVLKIARHVVCGFYADTVRTALRIDNGECDSWPIVRAAIKAVLAERDRCADIIESFAPGGERYEYGHDDASMRVAIREVILNSAHATSPRSAPIPAAGDDLLQSPAATGGE